MPRATQPERQRQDPWTCPPLRELPSTILVGCSQPGLKREGHLEDPGTPCSVNSGREGAPEDQGLRRLWLDGRWQAWGLMASSGHLLLFLFQPLTQRASEALCLGPHVALLLSRKQLRFARALTTTPPPPPHHVQGCCQELGEAASGFQLPILCLSQPWSLAGGSSLQQGEISGVSLLGTKAPHSEGQGR